MTCDHPSFTVSARGEPYPEGIHSLYDENMPAGRVIIRVSCGVCGEPFYFPGTMTGISPWFPTSDPDSIEMIAPIRPTSGPPMEKYPTCVTGYYRAGTRAWKWRKLQARKRRNAWVEEQRRLWQQK